MVQSFEQHFKSAFNKDNKTDYIRTHYDVDGFCSQLIKSKFTGNILMRLNDELVRAINKHCLLPKAILIVLDDNMLDDIDHYDIRISIALGRYIEWLTNQFHRVITLHKDRMKSKSRKYKYPTFLWALIPKHDIYGHYNEFKGKFNNTVVKACRNFREMSTLHLAAWDEHNLEYFSEGKLSPIGLSAYWHVINKAFEEWDKCQMKMKFVEKFGDQNQKFEAKPTNYFHRE